jgi:hypothetical protein
MTLEAHKKDEKMKKERTAEISTTMWVA